jgi:hypothetical protein
VPNRDEIALCAPEGQRPVMLHLTEPGAVLDDPWLTETLTLCGIPMCGCHWTRMERQPGDRLCPVCVDALGQGALALLTLLEAAREVA